MLTLFHAPASRSARVLWLIEELGLDCQVEKLAFGDGSMQSAKFLAVSPLGKVPALVDDGAALFESGAIVEYLLEKYGKGRLAPAIGTAQRGPFLQWVHWAEATFTNPLGDIIQHSFMLPQEQRVPAVVDFAKQRFLKALGVLEAALDGRDHLLGSEFSAADIMAGYTCQLAKMTGQLPADSPRVAAYLGRLAARPAFQKAYAR